MEEPPVHGCGGDGPVANGDRRVANGDRRVANGDGPAANGDRRAAMQFSRRAFLGGVAGAAGLAYLRPLRPFGRLPESAGTNPLPGPVDLPGGPVPDLALSVERPSDMLLLDFFFYGFQLQQGSPPAISPTSADNTIVVQFPPQAVAEASYFWHPQPGGSNELPVDPPPVLSQVAGPSRLCFQLSTSQSIPLARMSAEDLLDWSSWTLIVPNAAQVDGPSLLPSSSGVGGGAGGASVETRAPAAPSALETAIEFPYALYLAPVVYQSGLVMFGFSTGFESRAEPLVGPSGVTDLWSATLAGARNDLLPGTGPYVPEVSAFWARDYGFALAALPDATPEHFVVYGMPEIIQ